MSSASWYRRCFGWSDRESEDSDTNDDDREDDDDEDDGDGYFKLENIGETHSLDKSIGDDVGNNNQCTCVDRTTNINDSGENDTVGKSSCVCSADKTNSKSQPYSKADRKAKKLSRKLRRKEKRSQFLHFLRVTWKWIKRGCQATAPSVGAMFTFAPAPSAAVYRAVVARGTGANKSIFV